MKCMSAHLIDLHVHTTASDGTLSPGAMVMLAKHSGLRAVAITDHDTIDGVGEALAAGLKAGVEVVPGVEIGVDFKSEMHILGYFIDHHNRELLRTLAVLREHRDQRNPRMVEKLRQLGFDITMEEVAREADGKVVGRPHFASLMIKRGYVANLGEAFDKYLGTGKLAYVKKDKLTPREGIKLITGAGGIPVLAHPKYLEARGDIDLKELLQELMGFGLRGIEVYYTTHTPEETRRFRELADSLGLLVTGGTDFHGDNKPDIKLGRGAGSLEVEYDLLEKIKDDISR